jgi:carboxymethylenebutenolidase
MSEIVISQHAYYDSEHGGVDAFMSRPAAPGRYPALVVGHGWEGVRDWYRDFARKLAEQGFVVLIPDLYHGITTSDHAKAAMLKAELDFSKAVQETADGAAFLKGLPYVSGKVGVMGFCMGGGIALLSACRSTAFDAAVIYHHSVFPDPREIEKLTCPVQGHYGMEDHYTPPEEVKKFEDQLVKFNKSYEIHRYDGVGHGWQNPQRPAAYREDLANLTLQRTAGFFKEHLA